MVRFRLKNLYVSARKNIEENIMNKQIIFGLLLLITLSQYLKALVIVNHSHIPNNQLTVSIYEVIHPGKKNKLIARNLRFDKDGCLTYTFKKSLPGSLRAVFYSPDMDGDNIKEIVESFNLSYTEGFVLQTNHQAYPFPKLIINRRFKTEYCPSLNQRQEMRYGKIW